MQPHRDTCSTGQALDQFFISLQQPLHPGSEIVVSLEKPLAQADGLEVVNKLEDATHTALRSPLFFDDIASRQMGSTGKDFIKDETPPGLEE